MINIEIKKLKLHPALKYVPKMREEEFKTLIEDIKDRGIKTAIEVFKNTILDGQHRWLASKNLGLRTIPTIKPNLSKDEDIKDYVLKAAVIRRHLTDDQRAMMSAMWRKEHKIPDGDRKSEKFKESVAPRRATEKSVTHPTREKATTMFKVTRRQSDLASKVLTKNKGLAEKVHSGGLKLAEAVSQIREKEEKEEIKKIKVPKGKFSTIVIDPPWPMEKIIRDVRPLQDKSLGYPTMSIEEIKSFPIIKQIASRSCHIYLWTTQKFLRTAFEVFDAWNVKHRCLLTWIKNVGFTPFSFMYTTEFVLFGSIGNLPLLKKGKPTHFAAKVQSHSQKPDEFYELIKLVSPSPRIDVFSRKKHEGFAQYGHKTIKDK